jgi:hypothetical protein
MNETLPSKLHKVLGKIDTSPVSHVCQFVLRRLQYREMNYNHEGIALAHHKTFELLFLPPTEPDNWSNFADWLVR